MAFAVVEIVAKRDWPAKEIRLLLPESAVKTACVGKPSTVFLQSVAALKSTYLPHGSFFGISV